ncbi:MAG: putative ABC transport system permease protein [Bacteroidia bacterium]|jgi:putative ABC transport system permease protein
MLLVKIAWKNIWRNKVRSFVVITAISLGLWSGVFGSAFVQGMMKSKVEDVIQTEMSHIQIHMPKFRDEYDGSLYIANGAKIAADLRSYAEVEAVSERVISMGGLASSRKNGMIKLVGINPADEKLVSNICEKIIEGTYFESNKNRPIVISQKTAEAYGVKLNSKIIFTMQDIHGEITSSAHRIVGIYKSSNSMYDKMNAFVTVDQMRKSYRLTDESNELAVWLKDHEKAESLATFFQEKYTDLEILPWLDLSTGMRMMIEAFDIYLYIIVGIILVALLFSIVNTMLMAVLERVREIGMLMAIGMTKNRVFKMIMFETVFMTMIGAPIGLFLSWVTIRIFGSSGIDLSGAAYEAKGFGSTVYPYLEASSYGGVTLMVLVMSLLAAIYPALKALSLNPVEAIRKI